MSFVGFDTNFTLPSRFYTSTEIFEEELERIFYSRGFMWLVRRTVENKKEALRRSLKVIGVLKTLNHIIYF